MGKQSKRKGKGKVDKKDRKAELEERKNSILAASSASIAEGDNEGNSPIINKWTILVGDIVWFEDIRSDENDHNTRRGIVRKFHYDFTNRIKSTSIQPLKHFFESNEETWRVKENMIDCDHCNWTTRFDVGDQVVCLTDHGWLRATIANLWPVWEKNHNRIQFPVYKMVCQPLAAAINNEPKEVAAPDDDDYCVRRHQSTFRFSVKDEVTLDVFRAEHRGKIIQKDTSRWIPATVTGVDILGLEFYAVYQCEFQTSANGRTSTCWVVYDTDEYVAATTKNPRERLMDSIRQDCSYYHMRRLLENSDIDASLIQDLIVSTAIEFGSFAALRLLEYDMNLELASLKFDNGNTILHQIAQSQSCGTFLRGFARTSFEEDSLSRFSLTSYAKADSGYFWKKKNDFGETFLDLLLKTGDLRVLDRVFSPRNGLFWVLNKDVEEQDWHARMERAFPPSSPHGLLVSRALEDKVIHSQISALTFNYTYGTEEEMFQRFHFMKDLNRAHAVETAKKLIRFVIKWEAHNPEAEQQSLSNILGQVSTRGFYRIFRSLVEADPSLLKKKEPIRTSETRNEFVQEEMYPTDYEQDDYWSLEDIPTMITCGHASHPPYFISLKAYQSNIRHTFPRSNTSVSLLSHFEEYLKHADEETKDILRYQISLLQDPPDLPERLQIMDYLVSNRFIKPPSPLLPIRMRQCGVFRWLVDKSHVRLDKAAFSQLNTPDARKVQFLGGQRVPAFVSSGTFLCFACVEYDSLFALQWLVKDNSVALDGQIHGYNILHTCAYFGRLEIILWLHRHVQWPALLSKPSSRKGFENYSALHIALSRGFTNVVELMISLGHPLPEGKRLSLESLALKSPHKHVRTWGQERSLHVGLSKDICKLFKMLSKPRDYEGIKKFIRASRCVTKERWVDTYFYRCDHPLPSGLSYLDVILKCCETDDEEFVLWLCHEMLTKDNLYQPLHRTLQIDIEFWNVVNYSAREQAEQFVYNCIMESEDEELVNYSRQPWARKCNIENPGDHPMISKGLLSTVLSQRLWNELCILLLCDKLLSAVSRELSLRLMSGAFGNAVSELHSIRQKLVEKSIEAEHSVHKIEDYYPEYQAFTIDGRVKLGFYIDGGCGSETHPAWLHWPLKHVHFRRLPLYVFAAIENYTQLIKWLYNNGEGWSSEKEVEMVRISSYLGHDDLVNFFRHSAMYSSSNEIEQGILLGAGEAGREMVCRHLLSDKRLCDELADSCLAEFKCRGAEHAAQEAGDESHSFSFGSSLPAMIVYGYLSCTLQNAEDPTSKSLGHFSLLRALSRHHGHSPFSFFDAAMFILTNTHQVEFWESATRFFEFLHNDLRLNFGGRQYKAVLVEFSNYMLARTLTRIGDKEDRRVKVAKDILSAFERWGLDIQCMKVGMSFDKKNDEDRLSFVLDLQANQRARWSQFDLVKAGRPLEDIRVAFYSGNLTMNSTDRDGQKLVHLAAAYDRVDVLEWLVKISESILTQKDGEDRSALDSATASKARASTDWLQERQARNILSLFLKRNVRRRLAAARKAKRNFAIQRLQARQRGYLVRRAYRSHIFSRVERADRYRVFWEEPIGILTCANAGMPTWSSLRSNRESRSSQIDDIDEILESRETLEDALTNALGDESEDDSATFENIEDEKNTIDQLDSQTTPLSSSSTTVDRTLSCDTIHISTDVVKWLKRADGKFQKLFINKIDRLSRGEHSRTLTKGLKGTKAAIYESYLEQKSGHRLLWQQEMDGTIFVWYVSKHKNVSRLITLIDDCERRASRQRISASSLYGADGPAVGAQASGSDHVVRLNPLGNVPLRVYEVHLDKLDEILDNGWMPKLYLSPEERDIVRTQGTVLLLGRSGTGKTVCITNRIELDFWRFKSDPGFKQLFVARSRRLCRYVAETVGESTSVGFVVYSQLIRSLEEKLPVLGDQREVFLPTMKMDFARFKRDVYGCKSNTAKSSISIDPLVIWTSIRTFLKGSIEALAGSDNGHCDKASFLSFGKRRCRLSPGDRESVYKIFTRYQKFMEANRLWDDCDRTVSLLKRLGHASHSASLAMSDLRYSKIYVDEIQDYTQTEILLFFRLSGPGDLFLAGDPAQSVVEGVDFRFEEIRSVGYHVAGNHRDLIPQKPKTLTTNFRSHSGILEVAAAILRRMFEAFPDSAKQLGEDRGVFNGPRPGVFHRVDVGRLGSLVSEKLLGVTVLTHDSSVSYWKKALNYDLVYGVRAAKGLEFKSVIVLDFFAELPGGVQKHWRDFILGRSVDAPELEGQVKLLYTAVTRCIERLFFAETSSSLAGDAFVRWLTETNTRPTPLATRQNIDNLDKMAMTQDEWVSSGMDNAESAEMHAESNELTEAQSMLEKAIFCFKEGKDMALARKARTYGTSLTFRVELQETSGASEAVEIRAAKILQQLGVENLLLEARRLLDAVLPSVDDYTREQLEKGLLRNPILDTERMPL